MESISFPSLIEEHNRELQCVFQKFTDGLKIYHNNTSYIVGKLALQEGQVPHKMINCSPDELEYQVLAKTGLMLVAQKVQEPVSLTVGFPYLTYKTNKEKAIEFLKGKHEFIFDIFTPTGNHKKKLSVEVGSVDVIPEIVGCSITAVHEYRGENDSFVAGLGYGTFEACLINQQGVVERTLASTMGLRYAIDLAMREVNKTHSLDFINEHQFDSSFQKGRIIVGRKKVDLTQIRSNALKQYYNEVISPTLRNTWHDADFENSETLFLAGGGALYPELVECFNNEFGEILKVVVIDNPITAASRGYCQRSLKIGHSQNESVGLDIGNAATILSFVPIEKHS